MKRNRILTAIFLFLLSFGVYFETLAPTVTAGDSGELIAACYTLGIPHPPGYPLYCLLGRLFTFLPFGSIAYRVNLMSAFFASLTVVLVYLIILKIQVNGSTGKLANRQTGQPFACHIPALSASLLLAFSKSFWSQAVVAKFYTLNAFFLALSIFILLKWKEFLPTPNSPSGISSPLGTRGELPTPNSTRYLYLFALIYGLSLTTHYIMGLFAPAFILFILWTRPRIIKEAKTLFFILGLFLLPLTVYLYLPLRSLQNPPIDWGNPENWPNFLAHIRRLQYHGLEFAKKIPLKDKGLFISDFLRRLSHQFTFFLAWLGLIGIWRLFKKDKRFFSLSLLIFFSNSLGLISLLHFPYNPQTSFEFSVLYLPAYLIFSLWMGYGMKYLLKRGKEINRRIDFGGKSIYRYVTSLLILSLPLLPLSRNYFYNDRSRHYIAYDYGMNILKTLEKDSILFAEGDNIIFPLAYLQIVEHKCRDVTIYDRNRNLFENIYGRPFGLAKKEWKERKREIEDRIIATTPHPIYYTCKRGMEETEYILKPVGIVYGIQKGEAKSKNDGSYWKGYRMRGMRGERVFKNYMTREIIASYYYHLGDYYRVEGRKEKALPEYEKASRVGWNIKEVHYDLALLYQEERLYDRAIQEYERAIELDPDFALTYNNLGILYAQGGAYNKAEEAFRKAILLDPSFVKAYNNLGNIYGSQERYREARKAWEKALTLDLENGAVLANLKKLEKMGY